MKKQQAIKLLKGEGWTEADAIRAVEAIDFKTNPDELTIRRAISSFSGSELSKRQRLQAAQKANVTKKIKEIEQKDQEYAAKIAQLEKEQKPKSEWNEAEIKDLISTNQALEVKVKNLFSQNNELLEANDQLKKDNKALKNLVDQIKLQLAKDTKKLLQYEDSEIKKAVVKLFKWTLG